MTDQASTLLSIAVEDNARQTQALERIASALERLALCVEPHEEYASWNSTRTVHRLHMYSDSRIG